MEDKLISEELREYDTDYMSGGSAYDKAVMFLAAITIIGFFILSIYLIKEVSYGA